MMDTWTSPNGLNFLSVLASFVKDGVVCADVISFQELPAYHDATMLGETLFNLLEEFNLSEKVHLFSAQTCKGQLNHSINFDSYTPLRTTVPR